MRIKNLKINLAINSIPKSKEINPLDFELEKGRNSGEAIEFNFQKFIAKMENEYGK